jgi:cation diffusion facilitator family transporter
VVEKSTTGLRKPVVFFVVMSAAMKNIMKSLSTPTGAAKLSFAVVICLVILKIVVAILTNSVSIYAQATDSFLDIFSIGITYLAVRAATTPADEEHHFGHGKMEGIAALIQAVLVLAAGSFIIYSAIKRIITSEVIKPDEGMIVMVVSIIASFFLSRHLRRVAKTSGSTAIAASASNISADVYSAAGVLLGLLAVRLTSWVILDPVIALIMAFFVLKAGYEVVLRAFRELTDYTLPEEEQKILTDCIREHITQLVDFHAVRTRRSGSQRFVDLHLVMPRNISVESSHQMCDHLEKDIKERLPNSSIVIHVEPCEGKNCLACSITICTLRHA